MKRPSLLHLFLDIFEMRGGSKNKSENRILVTAAVRSTARGVRRLEYELLEGRDCVFFQPYIYFYS